MNIFLWVLQILLALHTAMGAVWKFSHSEQSVPSLSAMPHALWMALIAFEFLCVVGLLLPAWKKRCPQYAAVAAAGIAAEMLLFCAYHLASGEAHHGEMIYWLVVAALGGVVVYGRRKRSPV